MLRLLLLFAVCWQADSLNITYPVFPDVSFVFRDDYDPFGWRLTKPDFLQLPKSHPNDSPPVLMFYMRRSGSMDYDTPPFYSTDCKQCQVWVAFSYNDGMTWEKAFPFLGLPAYLDPTLGWWARAGLRVSLQQFDGVSSLHFGMGKVTDANLALFHFSTNESFPDGRDPQSRDVFPPAQLVMPRKVASVPHTPIVVNNGSRLLFPIHYVARSSNAPPYGLCNVIVFYSDDFGITWSEATPELVVPSPHGGDGANEPAVIELLNGTLWMLIRANQPVLYESYSHDHGSTWSVPSPTRFASYDSPAHLIRLRARGKPGILVIWTNGFIRDADGRYKIARQVIQGAVSYDEGSTWQGFRELYRDPIMDQSYDGDHGAAYPAGKEMENGNVIVSTGQAPFRQTVFVFDPRWLAETEQRTSIDDVAVVNDTTNYDGNYYTSYGVEGVERILDPTNTSCSRNLSVIRFDARGLTDPFVVPTVVYNFPGLKRGQLILTLYPASDDFVASIKIADFFSPPTVYFEDELASFAFESFSGCDETKDRGPCLSAQEWHIVQLDWDTDVGICNVTFDGISERHLELPMFSRTFVMQPSYLRLQVSAGFMYLREIFVGTPESV